MFWVGIAVASGAAVSYGVSTVLRYMGAQHVDQDQDGQAPDLASTARTFVTPQFLLGTLFLLLGFAGGAAAARFLPLFLAQTIVAANLVVTALLGAVLLGNRISRTGWAAIGLVIGSLAAMGFSAAKQGDGGHGTGFHWTLLAITVGLSVIGIVATHRLGRRGGLVGGAFAGVMFGLIAIGVRVLDGLDPFDLLTLISDPAAWTIAVAGSVGFYLQTVALQVGQVNPVTAMLVVGEVAIPGMVGILFLGDTAKHDLGWLAYTAFATAVVGAVLVALFSGDGSSGDEGGAADTATDTDVPAPAQGTAAQG